MYTKISTISEHRMDIVPCDSAVTECVKRKHEFLLAIAIMAILTVSFDLFS